MSTTHGCETAEQFEARMTSVLDTSMTSLCVALGHRLGLYDVFLKLKEPHTPQDLAKAAGMKTRYMEEWIGAMFCANILEVDRTGSEDRYFLPPHRVPYLTNKTNAAVSHLLPIVAGVYEDIVKCFPEHGPRGVSYDRYSFYNEWRGLECDAVFTPSYMSQMLKKHQKLDDKLRSGARVLSIGCNVGKVEMVLARMYTASSFLGIDIAEDGITTASRDVKDECLSNISFSVQDACNLPGDWNETYDVILAINVLHDLAFTTSCMAEVFRIMKEDGLFFVMDAAGHSRISDNRSTELGSLLYTSSLFLCMPVSLNTEGGEGLGTMWGAERAREMLINTGFCMHYEAEIAFNHLFVCGKTER